MGADPNTRAESVPATNTQGPVDESREQERKRISKGSVDCYFSMVKNLDTKETDYRCNWILRNNTECGKIFAKKDSVQRHIKNSHEGDRPFICNYCDTAFKQKVHMHRHIKNIHGIDHQPEPMTREPVNVNIVITKAQGRII